MHREDESNFLLFIEPLKSSKLSEPIEDELVEVVKRAMSEAKKGTADYSNLENNGDKFKENNGWMGWHTTDCGEKSGSREYLLKNGKITNSLAPFYLMWYRNSIPATEMKKLESLKEFYKSEPLDTKYDQIIRSRKKKDEVDMSKFWEEQKKREEEEKEEYKKKLEDESNRVKNLECPCCNSTAKARHHKTQSNGVISPGHHSRTIDDYYVCQACGVHYTDLDKKKIEKPFSMKNGML